MGKAEIMHICPCFSSSILFFYFLLTAPPSSWTFFHAAFLGISISTITLPVCTGCLRPWASSRFRTCDECRAQMHRSGDTQSFMSDLLWYFRRPRGSIFDNLTYSDFYARYYFETREMHHPVGRNQWSICSTRTRRGTRRKILRERQTGSRIVTRIHSIPPRIGELFYVRVLLLHRPASSFEDLRIIHGRVYAIY